MLRRNGGVRICGDSPGGGNVYGGKAYIPVNFCGMQQ